MKKIGKINVQVVSGNIATMPVDAIVVPQFTDCASYGGVGGAICRYGARAGIDEYNALAQKSPFFYGDAVITPSHGGTSKYLIHVATVGETAKSSFTITCKAVFGALLMADDKGIKSLAVPAIGSGIIGHLTIEQSAKAIFSAVEMFSQSREINGIENITMVIYGLPDEVAPAQEVLENGSYHDVTDEVGQKKFDVAEWFAEFSKDLMNVDR